MTLFCLVILTITFFALMLYSIVQVNLAPLQIGVSRFWSFKVLDASTSSQLFAAFLSALLIRHQFAVNLVPRIVYKSSISVRQAMKDFDETSETWRVEIRNTGLGSAAVIYIEYDLDLTDAKAGRQGGTYEDIIKELAAVHLIREQDYWLEHITPGFSLSPKDDCLVFEIKREHLGRFKHLNMVLDFKSQLGSKYRSEISLIPRFH